jgi:predicted nucleic acid-binding protein
VSELLGWLDTNLFVHSLFPRDPNGPSCRTILDRLERGDAEGWIAPVVVHELTYVLRRIPTFPNRAAIHDYIRQILLFDAIHAEDKEALLEALGRWQRLNVGFVDAWLAVLAHRRGMPVCSANRADFAGVPNTYPVP